MRVLSAGRWHPPLIQPPAPAQALPLIVAVGAARAGAGKSTVAANLAVAIAGLGRRVVLVDLDLRTPQQHQLLGLVPERGSDLRSWLERRRQHIDVAPRSTGVRNLRILPPALATREGDPPPLDVAGRRSLVHELYDVGGDVVVVDVGSGNPDDLFDFFATRALRLIVTGRSRDDLEATYGFLQSAVRRARHRHGEAAASALAQFQGGLVGNATAAPEEEETFHAFSRLVLEHLGIPLPVVGCLRSSDRVARSRAARQPLVAGRGVDENVRAFHQMAELLIAENDEPDRECALDVEGVASAPGPSALPVDLKMYERKHPRFPVDWMATLDLGTEVTTVRVQNVSESGAALESPSPLRVGDRGTLVLEQMPGRPSLPVVVKNLRPAIGRAGVAFLDAGRVARRLVAEARKLAPTN